VRYTEISLSALRELLQDAEPVQPQPELVASMRPSPADVMGVALRYGWYPAEPFLRPAVPIRQEDLVRGHCPVTRLPLDDCDCGACDEDDEMAEAVAQAWRGGAGDDGDDEDE
jgi:hypothetical protein